MVSDPSFALSHICFHRSTFKTYFWQYTIVHFSALSTHPSSTSSTLFTRLTSVMTIYQNPSLSFPLPFIPPSSFFFKGPRSALLVSPLSLGCLRKRCHHDIGHGIKNTTNHNVLLSACIPVITDHQPSLHSSPPPPCIHTHTHAHMHLPIQRKRKKIKSKIELGLDGGWWVATCRQGLLLLMATNNPGNWGGGESLTHTLLICFIVIYVLYKDAAILI